METAKSREKTRRRTGMSEAGGTNSDPMVGRTFDGYRVEGVIGRGGMGVVYKATQLSLGRPVAIKVLPAEFAERPQFLERFHREVDVLSKLSHPNIVTVMERGEVDGRPYLVMEYIDGTSLRELIAKGPLPRHEALSIVRTVLGALEHAHGRGIVHRDIKPENVLIAPGGIVKVADFGLSRLLGPADLTRLTHTHLMLGTFEYMSPEQREKAKEADERSDIYAAGVVLYETLAGELPIGAFDKLSVKRPGECDSRLDAIIERSLNKEPSKRYQRASEMGDALSGVLTPMPSASAPTVASAAAPHERHGDGEESWTHWMREPWTLGGYIGGIWMVVLMTLLGYDLHSRQWTLMGITCGAVPLFLASTARVLTLRQRVAGTSGLLLVSTIGVLWLGGHTPAWGDSRRFTVARYTGEFPEGLAERVLFEPELQVWMKSRISMWGNYPDGVAIDARDGVIRVMVDKDLTRFDSTAQEIASALGLVLERWGGGAVRRTYTASAPFEEELKAYPPPGPVKPPTEENTNAARAAASTEDGR
jgi:predicted Ser/Thr protein kinase